MSAEMDVTETYVENDEGSDVEMDDAEDEEVPIPQHGDERFFSLEVLKVLKEAQQARGLRHGDYVRYRQYCGRKIHRLRKSLKFSQGNRTRYHGKALKAEMVTDSRYLQIHLFVAERAWSYGMQLKQESAGEHPRIKLHMLRKFNRAALWASQLDKLCGQIKTDARTRLEAEAYFEWMSGVFCFHKNNWKEALEAFSHSKAIYETIASTVDAETRILYQQRIDETVPQIRFCAYNIGDQSAVDDLIKMRLKPGSTLGDDVLARLDDMIAQNRGTQAQMEVNWLGKTVPLKNEKVRVLLISSQEVIKQLDNTDTADGKLEVLENTLNMLREALHLVQEDIKATAPGKETPGQISGVQLLQSYLTYLKNERNSQRALLTIDIMRGHAKLSPEKLADEKKKKHKPQDFIRLYDTVVENNIETSTLPGVVGTVVMETTNCHTLLYKAYRALYIGMAFVGVKKYQEALTFFARANEFLEQATSAASKLERNEALKAELSQLTGLIATQKDTTLTFMVLNKDEFAEVESEIVSRHRNIATNELELPAAKPFTFDLVLNAIKLPSLEDRITIKKPKGQPAVAGTKGSKEDAKQPAGPGLGSMVKGWIWGSKKS